MTRLAVGPVNSAGQAHAWARAVQEHTDAEAFSFGHAPVPLRGGGLRFPTDRSLPHHRLTPRLAKAVLLRRLLRGVTHLAVDSFASLYDRLDTAHLGLELPRLAREHPRLAVALIAHGSDLRDPDRHAERLTESYYRDSDPAWVQRLREVSARNRATARDSALPLFVSTPDLLLEDVAATWLPVVVDPALWQGEAPPLTRERPVVVHVPSRRTPPIKGTDSIDAVLRELDAAGRVRYVSPTAVPHSEIRALVRGCDILIEQTRSGYYGVNAVEGLAAGRVVVGSLAPDVAALMPEVPPLLSVRPDTLCEVLEHVLTDRDAARDTAARGPGFVARVHDGRASAAALAPWLGVSLRA